MFFIVGLIFLVLIPYLHLEEIREKRFVVVSTTQNPENKYTLENEDYLTRKCIENSNKRFEEMEKKIENRSKELEGKLEQKEEKIFQLMKRMNEFMILTQSTENLNQKKFEKFETQIKQLQIKVQEKESNIIELAKTLNKLVNLTQCANNAKNINDIKKKFDQFEERDVESQQQLSNLLEKPRENVTVINPIKSLPKNCKEVMEHGNTKSGIYQIQPKDKVYNVQCNMERGGGWTVFQKKFDGSQDFSLNWQSYKNGFGNLSGEFWLGLQPLHEVTGAGSVDNELLILMVNFGTEEYAYYKYFGVGNDQEKYMLKGKNDGYNGTTPDIFLEHHVNQPFSTKDRDNTLGQKCAQQSEGGWWFRTSGSCFFCNLNGKYYTDDLIHIGYTVSYWYPYSGSNDSLQETQMMVRPH